VEFAFDFDTVKVDGLASLEITAMNGETLILIGVTWDQLL